MNTASSSSGTSTIQILPESSTAQQSIAQSLTSHSISTHPPPTNSNGIWDKSWVVFLLGAIPTAIVTFFLTIISVRGDVNLNSISIAEIKKDIETLKESDKKIESIEKSINDIHTDIAIIKERGSKNSKQP